MMSLGCRYFVYVAYLCCCRRSWKERTSWYHAFLA